MMIDDDRKLRLRTKFSAGGKEKVKNNFSTWRPRSNGRHLTPYTMSAARLAGKPIGLFILWKGSEKETNRLFNLVCFGFRDLKRNDG